MDSIKENVSFQIYTTPPFDWQNQTGVACAYFLVDQEMLCLQNSDSKKEKNLWGIPGGKVEPEESHKDALIRELREELGLELSYKDLGRHTLMFVRKSNWDITLSIFDIELMRKPVLRLSKEHQTHKWIPQGTHHDLDMRLAEHEAIDHHLVHRSFKSFCKV